ncbi:TetR/AcrR family transcriptional regulator C-terminal ligand-binding domain-containing protein [Amycolatopsis sp. PS_44_ISF1]|uniref:TetR/AcrR family transcriptional regulator n=1 Tax=Amycolatopsis sp. PS_44_ISF1 TaxID=2974917 RepID=UPI0028DF34FC|nr:TetR/AcrR family transcriptional regulator C-terminal ligand-binding domain-containing protein [Amycolatopsis sp. PS_44_ISF1]MDT8911968.1 TetR/AcrR family transcriptional regulator [Amycolatopsis sp. PS_44_ISF1]
MTEASGDRARPGGRTARTRLAVHAAVRTLLGEGRDPISVREVAERSGVHEVTVYRRWKTIESLVLDVAVTHLNEESPFPDTGDLRADLLDWARSVAEQVSTHEGFALYRALAAAGSALQQPNASPHREEAAAYLLERTSQIQRAIDHDSTRRANPPTVAEVFDVVLAPIYLRAIFGYQPPGEALDVLVDRLLGQH